MTKAPEIWADVGGTFTDVFVVKEDQTRQATKTLSSGLVYATIVAIDGGRITVDKLPASDCVDFWKAAKWSSGDHRSGTIIAQHDTTVDLGEAASSLELGDSLVFNGGIEAPVLAARMLLGVPIAQPLPPLGVRLGTTRGTNALLTRSGAKTALLTTKGFGDVLRIGEQQREDLFAVDIIQPQPLTQCVVQVDARMDASGNVLKPLDEKELHSDLADLKRNGIQSIAIALMHAYTNDSHERQVELIARQVGFSDVSRSSEVSPLIKLVSRAETTTLDAYLNPILSDYVVRLRKQFGGDRCQLSLMTSAGNLVSPENFRGRDSVLSGPAGGVVALASVAKRVGDHAAIGLDMGGTSTDVSRYEGKVGRRTESKVAGLRIMTPMMDIHTVAAGGGSICGYTDGRMTVGPGSAGALPGPACYGHGGPLTVTDVNLLLGRLPESKFPFRLARDAAEYRLSEIAKLMGDSWPTNAMQLAEGFLDIAITHMAEAVRTVSTAEGSDVRKMTLVGFGGAAGGHLCRVANQLGMNRILDHPDAGLMSALGMGMASVGTTETTGIYRPIDQMTEHEFLEIDCQLRKSACEKLDSTPEHRTEIDLRYAGTESSLAIEIESGFFDTEALKQAFHRRHREVFGYNQTGRDIEVVSLRCDATIPADPMVSPTPSISNQSPPKQSRDLWCQNTWISAELLDRDSLSIGNKVQAPSLIVGPHSTLLVEPGWQGIVMDGGVIQLDRVESETPRGQQVESSDDPVLLEIIARRLQGIADTMGEVLRRTSISVNVKERRDYSCAVFNDEGALVANAAHVPVHLGAMGHTVRHLASVFPTMSDGDCYLSNDPFAGGSHLPDITLVTPVFINPGANDGRPDFFVASRAHHAEIGGKTPGSMPPDATCLAEEGVLIRDFALIRSGIDQQSELKTLLSSGPYPSRNPDENLADLAAQSAAGVDGVRGLRRLCADQGISVVDKMMNRLLDVAAEQTERFIESLCQSSRRFEDRLDDGTLIGVTITRNENRLTIAFDPTPVHPNGFNATPAIVTAATLYVLRCVCPSELPLCDGVLRSIDLQIPEGLLNPPAHQDTTKCAAVVAGNVETSQRLVDVLLGAFDAAAASQGTMNNTLIGDETFGYYETIAGGAGATRNGDGASGVHTHMTNTRITDPEVVETRLPIRLHRFEIRTGSGGDGQHRGGDGLVREFEFLKPLTVSLLTNRRATQPYGSHGGQPGQSGKNTFIQDGNSIRLPPNATFEVNVSDRLMIETPGGGGWGTSPGETDDESEEET